MEQGKFSENGQVTYTLKLNYDYYVVTANDLIRGKQTMTEREIKLLLMAISQVMKQDKELKTYTTTVPELAKFMQVSTKSLYKDLKEICKKLLQRIVEIKIGDGKKDWKIFQWVNMAKFEDGVLTIRLSEDIKPYILELSNSYTQIVLGTIIKFSGYYTTRLYQILKCDYGERKQVTWEFSCDEIREVFQTKDKYKNNRDLVNRTIKQALEELNKSDFVHISDYTEIFEKKKGNPLVGVKFKAYFFDTAFQKQEFFSEQPELLT